MGQAPDAVGRGNNYPNDTNYGTYVDADAAAAGSDMDTNPDTEVIVNEIENTRSEMTDTIDAIQERLSPDHLKEQAREMVRDATVGKAQDMVNTAGDTARNTGNGIMETIRQNPLPAAVAGLGIAWLWKNRSSGQQSSQQYSYYSDTQSRQSIQPYYYQPPTSTGRYQPPAEYSTYRGQSGQSGQSSSEGGLRETASNVTGAVSGTASHVADTAGNVMSSVGHTAGDAVSQVGHLGQQAGSSVRENYDQMIRESPMTLGVVALGLGLAAGMMIPETQKENELMGERKEQLMDKAQTVAQETMDKVQQVASQATDTVQQSAQQQGLTSS